MKTKVYQWLEVAVLSVNYILISYALSNLTMLLRTHPLFILFFFFFVCVIAGYWRRTEKLTGSRVLSAALLVVCFAAHLAMVYFFGRVVGEIVPFRP